MRCERQQGDIPCLLDGARQTALVGSTDTREPPGHDLATLGNELLQKTNVPIGDGIDLLGAELADFLAAEELATSAGSAAGASAGTSTGSAAGPAGSTTARPTGGRCCCACFGRPGSCFVSHT